MTVRIISTYFENYADDPNDDYWKNKGEGVFVADVPNDLMFEDEQMMIDICKKVLEGQSNRHCRYEFISMEFKFSKPENVTKEFIEIANKEFHYDMDVYGNMEARPDSPEPETKVFNAMQGGAS